MAFTVTLKSNKKCFLAGDTFKLTATLAGVEEGAVPQNVSYAWTKNDQPIENESNVLIVSNATSESTGRYKVSVTDKDTQEVIESTVLTMNEAELVVKLNHPSRYVAFDEELELTATVSYSTGVAPSSNYQLHYKWERDQTNLNHDKNTLTINKFVDEDNGTYRVTVWGESEASADSASAKFVAVAISVIEEMPLAKTVVLGKPIMLPYRTMAVTVGDTSELPKLTVHQSWYLQREGQSSPTLIGDHVGEAIEGFSIMPNGYLHKDAATMDDKADFWCVVALSQEIDGQPVAIEEKGSFHCSLDVVESLHTMFRYVHPIPWRKTSFIYIGWWVFDEIVKFNEAGLEWRERDVYEDSRYANDIETIAAAEEKYGDCICMESRNGFMYNSKEFHKLDREILEKVLRIRETPPVL